MKDEERAEAIIEDGKHSVAKREGDTTLQAVPTQSAAATQLSFAAAGNQFIALTQFGSEEAYAISDRARVTAQRRKEFESTFIRDGVLEIDSNGYIRAIYEYNRAVEAIWAKAIALGYGAAESQAAPITSVPGGYVGRYQGNDIYAAAR